MTRTPNPRFRADIKLEIEISGTDDAEVAQRLETVYEFIRERLSRTTFRRLAGQPALVSAEGTSEGVVL